MSLRARCGLAVICVTVAVGGSSCSHEKTRPDPLPERTRAAHASINTNPALSTFALYAKNSIHLGPNVLEFVGDIGVQPGSGPFLSPGSSFRAESGAQTDINWTILAGSVSLAAGASTGDVQTDFLDDASGAATHGQMAALVPLPAMPNASPVLPGTVDLVVGTDDVLSLTPASYAHGRILGTVNLAPGLYQFADLDVGAGGNLLYTGPTEVRVAQRLSTGEYANLRPADGSVAGASDFRLEVSGTNGASGALGDTPAAATFGSNTYFKGLVLVPNGTVAGMRAGKIDGALFARDIDVEESAYIAREGGFPDSVGATCATPCLPLDSCHTAGVCDPATGLCSQPALPEGTSCSDGNVCNGAETCNAQAHCTAGAAPVVDDGNPCTGDVCDAVSGVRHVTLALGTSCADGNACNGAETCDSQGVCTPGAAPVVDDHNPCTVDSCTATGGVAHEAAAAGTSCSDGIACNGAETCNGNGSCIAGVGVVIDDGNPCTADSCDATGAAVHQPVAAGTACSDGNVCSGLSTCDAVGHCAATAAVVVDDGNPCTVDSCDPITGAHHVAVAAGTSCSDGNACNGTETCSAAGSCVAGAALSLDDGNPCTTDGCSPATGVLHVAVVAGTACSDGNACNGAETCNAAGTCTGSSSVVVDDGNPCTLDACDPAGGVQHVAVAPGTSCSDGNTCNGSETCDASGHCAAGTAVAVDDGNPCTSDSCSPASGVTHVAVAAGTACSDGNACNGSEACTAQGLCTGGTPIVLDDANPCTADSCDPSSGVTHSPVLVGTNCSDGNACNGVEACDSAGHCSAATTVTIDDGNPCTVDSCDATSGITHVALAAGSSCSDGNLCNGNETCDAAGACTAGTAIALDDHNPCTADSCNSATGVAHAPLPSGSSCSDGNLCNGEETCDAQGACNPGTIAQLDDGDPCTLDTCDPVTGVHRTHCTRLDPTAPGVLADETKFLYTGTDPIQVGVDPLTIQRGRASVVRGSVHLRSGAPLAGVEVTVLGHPELGITHTQLNGSFDMAVNGGTTLTLVYRATGYLEAQRTVELGWGEYAIAADTAMVTPDPQVTAVDLNTANYDVAEASESSDGRGRRRARLLLPPGTQAEMQFADGTTRPIEELHIRATEYTAGPWTIESMPAVLPATTAYTYAVEFNADEAVTAGARELVSPMGNADGWLSSSVQASRCGVYPSLTSRGHGISIWASPHRRTPFIPMIASRPTIRAPAAANTLVRSSFASTRFLLRSLASRARPTPLGIRATECSATGPPSVSRCL